MTNLNEDAADYELDFPDQKAHHFKREKADLRKVKPKPGGDCRPARKGRSKQTDLQRAALEYAEQGLPVFPVRFNKTPYTANGVLDATTDAQKIEAWWDRWPGANVALAAGEAGLLVLDLDPGADFEKAERAVGDLPETELVATTPRGGEHHYYQLDPGDEPVANSASKVAEHVDVRSFHGYVLLPPSRTKDGAYEWAERGEPARRSDDLLEACARKTERSEEHDTWLIEPDISENVDLARQWLRGEREIGSARCRSATEGAGGDGATYAAAAMMKSCGLSEGSALEVLWEEWNHEPEGDRPGCSPPWDYEELELKVENAYRYNTSPPGNVTPAYKVARASQMFEPAKVETLGEGRQITVGKYRGVAGQGIAAIEPPEWLLPEWLPQDSYAMLVGAPGSYKTAVALDMALTIATGGAALVAGEWRGLQDAPRKVGPALFLVGEGRSGLSQRAEAWLRLHMKTDRIPKEFVLGDPVPHVNDESIEALVEMARGFHPNGYRLVVLDTVARAMAGVNENAQENATAMTALADAIRRELGASVLALHHTGHEHRDRARGSSAFLGDLDASFTLVREYDRLRIANTKQKEWEAWEEPRWARVEAVKLDAGRTSFAVVRGEAPRGRAKSALGQRTDLMQLDNFVIAVLRENQMRELSHRELSELVACHKETGPNGEPTSIGRTDRTLRRCGKVSLTALLMPENKARSRRMYDPAKERWRYSPAAAETFEAGSYARRSPFLRMLQRERASQ